LGASWPLPLAARCGIAALVAGYVGHSGIQSGFRFLAPLINYHPDLPLRIYTEDGVLIGEYGEERRAPVKTRMSR